MSTELFTCWGPICQGCGTAHRSERGARHCCSRHQQACYSQKGYSDRGIRKIEKQEDAMSYHVLIGPGEPMP